MQLWMGVVENRKDPLMIGRVQVRIIGQHTSNKQLIPTAELPWAICIMPVNDNSSISIKESDLVVGTYLDGEDAQQPIVFGIIPGIPDQLLPNQVGFSDPRESGELSEAPRLPKSIEIGTGGVNITDRDPSRFPFRLDEPTTSRLARNEKITESAIQFKKETSSKSIPIPFSGSWDEPESPYAAKYPYNRVMETESGHVIELDDTPGAERVHIYHRSGSSDEFHPDGTKVSRVNADSFEIVLSDKMIYVNGDCNITSKRSINLKSGKDINIEAGGNFNVKSSKMINLQSAIGINSWTPGPHSIQGLPLNLNAATPPPLGPPSEPMTTVENSTTVVLEPLQAPDPTEPGNVVLEERPGANLGYASPIEPLPQTQTPQGIPKPVTQVPLSVPTLTSLEGADIMIRALNRAKITDPIQRAMIYAQASHESAGFTRLVEDFRYTSEGMIKTFPKVFNAENVVDYIKLPEKIANRAYAGKMGNGSEASGDGWKYRGRGFIQLTGKENYLSAAKAFNQDFVNYPDAAAVPNTAADIAVWFFMSGKRRGYKGSYADITAVTKFVNGGLNGLEDRTARFILAKENKSVIQLTSAV